MSEENDPIYLMLGRIEGKLDHALRRTEANETAILAQGVRIDSVEEKLRNRIADLEKRQNWMLGAVAVITSIATWLGTKFTPFPQG